MNDTNDYYSKPKDENERRNVSKTLYKPLTFFLIVAGIVLFMSIFFTVSDIEVKGNSEYSDEEIIFASGIADGDNLFFLNRIAAGTRIIAKLPYIDRVSVTCGLPNRCLIAVEESKAVGCIEYNGEKWIISQSGKLLGTVKAGDETAVISGLSIAEPKKGNIAAAAEGSEDKLAYLLELVGQLSDRGIADKISAIDVFDLSAVTLEYDNRFTVKLGDTEDTEYKLGKMLAAADKLGTQETGTLDVSSSSKVNFYPN